METITIEWDDGTKTSQSVGNQKDFGKLIFSIQKEQNNPTRMITNGIGAVGKSYNEIVVEASDHYQEICDVIDNETEGDLNYSLMCDTERKVIVIFNNTTEYFLKRIFKSLKKALEFVQNEIRKEKVRMTQEDNEINYEMVEGDITYADGFDWEGWDWAGLVY